MIRGGNVSFPPKGRGLLHGHPHLYVRRQDAVAVSLRLVLENLPRWHGHNAGMNPFSKQILVSLHRKADLAARRDDDRFRVSAWGVGEHVGSLCDAGRGRVLTTIQSGQGLS